VSATDRSDQKPRINAIPRGYHTASPYLIVSNAAAALEYYCTVFDAAVKRRLTLPDGKVMHAEINIGDSIVMLADEFPSHEAFAPEHFGGSPAFVVLYLENAGATYARALAAGAVSVRPMVDQPFGERSGTIRDPFGHRWTLTTHMEDVPDEKIEQRFAAMMSGAATARTGSKPQ
jgi:PhnB protein